MCGDIVHWHHLFLQLGPHTALMSPRRWDNCYGVGCAGVMRRSWGLCCQKTPSSSRRKGTACGAEALVAEQWSCLATCRQNRHCLPSCAIAHTKALIQVLLLQWSSSGIGKAIPSYLFQWPRYLLSAYSGFSTPDSCACFCCCHPADPPPNLCFPSHSVQVRGSGAEICF